MKTASITSIRSIDRGGGGGEARGREGATRVTAFAQLCFTVSPVAIFIYEHA